LLPVNSVKFCLATSEFSKTLSSYQWIQ